MTNMIHFEDIPSNQNLSLTSAQRRGLYKEAVKILRKNPNAGICFTLRGLLMRDNSWMGSREALDLIGNLPELSSFQPKRKYAGKDRMRQYWFANRNPHKSILRQQIIMFCIEMTPSKFNKY